MGAATAGHAALKIAAAADPQHPHIIETTTTIIIGAVMMSMIEEEEKRAQIAHATRR